MYSKLPIQKCRTLEIVYETIIASLNLLIFLIYNPQVQSALNTMALLIQNMFLFSENKINVQHYILHLLSNSVTDVWTVFFSSVFIQNVIKQTSDKITNKIQIQQANFLKYLKKRLLFKVLQRVHLMTHYVLEHNFALPNYTSYCSRSH